MINGIGIDTLFKPRLYRLLSRRHNSINRLCGRILTLNEQNDLNSRMRSLDYKLNYLGVRWSAKEAAFKAFYPRFKPKWKDIEVLKINNKPYLLSHLDQSQHLKLHLSITHDGEYINAFVIIEDPN